MTIKFTTKGNAEISQIYIRLRDAPNEIDVIKKTGLSVFKKNFSDNNIVYNKLPKDAAKKKATIKQNEDLDIIEDALKKIKTTILTAFNNRNSYERINAKWVQDILHPPKDNTIPNELTKYFDNYLNAKQTHLRHSTIKKLKVIQNRLKRFETDTKTTTYLQEVNNAFIDRFRTWSNKNNYHVNTFIKTIKVVSTVCKHANEKHDIELHPHTFTITKGKEMEYKKSLFVYLDFNELQKIKDVVLFDNNLKIARDWLLISCNTAQRVSDFMRYSLKDIKIIDGIKYLNISQDKTEKPVLVYLNDVVLDIMAKYDNDFPPLYHNTSKEYNEIKYNEFVKLVCKRAGITDKVTCQIKNKTTNRVEVKTLEKYKFVSSHIGRRSYASNYYGIIDVSLLMSATGHATEKQFLKYVSKPPQQRAVALAKAMQKLANTNNAPMHVVKNTGMG